MPRLPTPGDSFIRHPMQHPVKNREEQIDAAMYIEPWIGWRCWAVKTDLEKVWLESITYSSVWTPEEEFTASCITTNGNPKDRENAVDPHHHAPNVDCGCGIYSVTDIHEAHVWLNERWAAMFYNRSTMRCMGEVKLWGNVIRFTKGFLAEKAYPKTILVPHQTSEEFPIDSREIVHELRKAYRGVKVNLL